MNDYAYALGITTTDLSSHVPCVYRETPLGYLIYLRKALWPYFLDPYTENNIWGDYYAHILVVYREWHLLDNPGERPDYLNSSCHLSLLVWPVVGVGKFFGVFFLILRP